MIVKKIASFILLCLLAFNWFGYRLVVNYIQHQEDYVLEAKLNNNIYDESQLIELKFPINLAYQNTRADYERCDGQVEYRGTYYKYVKRKIANDTLYLKCIRNSGRSTLEMAKNDFFKNSNDISQPSGKQDHSKTTSIKNLLSEFDHCTYTYHIVHAPVDVQSFNTAPQQAFVPNPFIKFDGQPPDYLC